MAFSPTRWFTSVNAGGLPPAQNLVVKGDESTIWRRKSRIFYSNRMACSGSRAVGLLVRRWICGDGSQSITRCGPLAQPAATGEFNAAPGDCGLEHFQVKCERFTARNMHKTKKLEHVP